MTVANDLALAVDGSSLIATHLISSHWHLVNLPSDSQGNPLGTRTEWLLTSTGVTNTGGVNVCDIFNTSTSLVRIRGAWIIPTQSAISAAQITYQLLKTSAIGTGGTVETPRPLDTTYAALPAGITARSGATAGATTVFSWIMQCNWNEEQDTVNSPPSPQLNNQTLSLVNLLPVLGDRAAEIVLHTNEGIKIQNIGGATGLTSSLFYFVVDN